MESTTPLRRSGRKRKIRKYSLDPLEGIDGLSDARSSNEDHTSLIGGENGSQDDEFAGDGADVADDVSVEYNEEESGGSNSEDESDFFKDDDGAEMVTKGGGELSKGTGRHRKGRSGSQSQAADDSFHSVGKKARYINLFGSNKQNLVCALEGRDKWASNTILPKRNVDEEGRGGFRRSFFRTEEITAAEAINDWEWYYDGGGRLNFERNQIIRVIENDSGQRYMPPLSGGDRSFLMGPHTRQKVVTLEAREWVSVEDVWRDAEKEHQSNGAKHNVERGSRQGWMLNAGADVQELTWAPNEHGRMQYFALATAPSAESQDEDEEPSIAPAYAPSLPSPASIQFWAMSPLTDPEREGGMDCSNCPKLKLVLCTNWGGVRQIKWCPAARKSRDEGGEDDDHVFLAGVWGDGKVRVLRLSLSDQAGSSTRYRKLCLNILVQHLLTVGLVRVEKAAFESGPPDTICTCVDWLSASHIAVGCANGFVAIWDLAEHLVESSSASISSSNPRPFFYQPLHHTYILAVASCYPSHADLILTTSMDGYSRLTDIHSPTADHALSPRSRIGNATLAWCDPIQSVLSAEDNNVIRALPCRRFHNSIVLARHTTNITALAVGSTHTTLLAGGADGSVLAYNPMRKIVNFKGLPRQLTWFLHEWRREAGGISRISEGFKVDSPVLFKNSTALKLADGVYTATVFEGKSAITHLAWNPNVLCGGWAAAGMGSGLVRVEDLAI